MKFTKMQGVGNDYIYVNCFMEKIDSNPLSTEGKDRKGNIKERTGKHEKKNVL